MAKRKKRSLNTRSNMPQVDIVNVNQKSKKNKKTKKNNNKKKFKLFILIFIFAVLILSNKDFLQKILPSSSNKTLQVIQKYPTNQEEKVRFYDDLLIKWNGKSVIALNKDGTSKWEKEINFENPLVFLGTDTIYICEGNTGDLYFLDLDGRSLNRIQMENHIKKIVEKDGLIFITLETEDGEKLTIMDKEGVVQNNILLEDKRLLNFSANEDKTNIVLSTLGIEKGDLNSKLIFYKEKGEYVSELDFNEEIIISMEFVDENSIVVFTDSRLYFVEEGNTLWKRDMEHIKDMYVNTEDKDIYILTTNTLEVISYKNKVEESISLNGEYNKVEGFNKGVLLVGDNKIIGINNGRENLKYEIQEKIENVIINDSDIILFTDNRINIMTEKKINR
ncbi:hypothetical protein KQH90_09755 [Anaerosalibacter bizertensis]|uniref:DUF5711 family protein n=1 Tax=Anaerosalibacter bizertensis TaxID=932217 RepID=UPI001C0EB4E0|nr:hypothetical protein [Anaerosalibacter bizertensis]